jgi:hypothetical protein
MKMKSKHIIEEKNARSDLIMMNWKRNEQKTNE